MTRLILLAVLALGINNLKSQTYVKPVIGYGFSKNTGPDIIDPFEFDYRNGEAVSDKKFTNGSFSLGLRIEKYITPKVAIFGGGHYVFEKQEMEHSFPFSEIFEAFTRFRRINFEFAPTYNISSKLKLGLGGVYSLIRDFEIYQVSSINSGGWVDISPDVSGDSHLVGLFGLVSYSINNFEVELNYSLVSKMIEPQKTYVEKSSAIQIALGYKFGLNKHTNIGLKS